MSHLHVLHLLHLFFKESIKADPTRRILLIYKTVMLTRLIFTVYSQFSGSQVTVLLLKTLRRSSRRSMQHFVMPTMPSMASYCPCCGKGPHIYNLVHYTSMPGHTSSSICSLAGKSVSCIEEKNSQAFCKCLRIEHVKHRNLCPETIRLQ